MKYNIFLPLIVLLLNLSIANADDKRVLELINSQQYEKAYPILEKEIHLGDYSHAHILAQMYEGGFGVAQDSKKAVFFHEKAVYFYKVASSAYRLGQYYSYGKIVDKVDKRKAAYWLRLGATLGSIPSMEDYSLINLDNDLFYTLVSSKWMQLAEKKGSKKVKKYFEIYPAKKDTEIFEILRKYNISQTPYEKKLLGIVLGEKFNEELLIRDSKDKPYIQVNQDSQNSYIHVSKRYANQNDKYFKNLLQIDVRTSLYSDTVYKVQGYYFFKSIEECEAFEKNQKGTRHMLLRYPSKDKRGFIVQVTVLDFEARKLKIAEALAYDPFFEYVGKEYPKAHSSRKHFGVTLLEKIPPSIQKKLISSSSYGNTYEIFPKYPHKFFQRYKVTTSLLTDTIVKIEASALFTNEMDKYNALEGTKMAIYDKYNFNKDSCWNDNKVTIDSKKGIICYKKEEGKNQLSIYFDSNKYAFTFRVESVYAQKLKNKEYWLLND